MKAKDLQPRMVIDRFGIQCKILSVRPSMHPIGGACFAVEHERLDNKKVSNVSFKWDHDVAIFNPPAGLTAELVAVEFSRVLQRWLGEDRIEDVVHRNRSEESSCCHSHDFCDANMAMDEALENLGSPWPYFEMDETERKKINDARTDLWNAAWDLSKKAEFKVV